MSSAGLPGRISVALAIVACGIALHYAQLPAQDGRSLLTLHPAVVAVLLMFAASTVLIGVMAMRLRAALASSLQAEQRLHHLGRATPAMMHSIDQEGHLLSVSDLWLSKLGYRREDVIGRRVFDFMTIESRLYDTNAVLPALLRGEAVENVEAQMLGNDGTVLEVLMSKVLEYDHAGRPLNSLAVLIDITERKAAERRLAESEARYRAVIEDQTEMVSLASPDGHLLFVNHAHARQFGFTPDEMIGSNLFDHLPEGEQPTVAEHLARVCASEEVIIGENRIASVDGSGPRWFSFINRAVRNERGVVTAVHSVGRDITEQKTLATQLLAAAQEVEDLYDQAPCGYHSVGANGNYIKINATELEWLGCSRGEVLGRLGPRDFVVPGDRSLIGAAFHQARDTLQTQRLSCRLRGRHGVERDVSLNISVVLDEDGSFLMTRSVMFDITAQKDAERALESSQSLLERTGAVAGVGGWEYDLRSGELLWTRETCRIHGVPDDYRPNVAAAIDFYTPDSRSRIQAAVDAAIQGGPNYDLELQILRADGTPIWVRTAGLVESAEGRPVRLIGALQDITAKVEQMAHVEQLYALSEAQRAELAVYHDRAESEAEMAGFLLSRLSRTEQLDASGVQYYWQPAESFSGDIIAVASSSSGDTYGMLADATGHGLAAAINLIPLTSAFYAMAAKGFSLTSIGEQLNKVVKDYSLADRFVAVTLVRLHLREQLLDIVNAGNPAALLLDGERRVLREFRSSSIPLGILDRPFFKPVTETVELTGKETLLVFSDGLVEAGNAEAVQFGRIGVERALSAAADSTQIADSLRQHLNRHASGLALADDVSVLVLPATTPEHHHRGVLTPVSTEALLLAAPVGAIQGQDGEWSLELHFSSSELKSIEAVPTIVDLTRNFGLPASVEPLLFTVMSELFQNALEHGVLALDSRIKAEIDGFERYLGLRAERLAALVRGEVTVRMSHARGLPDGGRLRILVRDSGAGFDHRRCRRALAAGSDGDASARPFGRGLALLDRLCQSVEFNTRGNEVTVELAYA